MSVEYNVRVVSPTCQRNREAICLVFNEQTSTVMQIDSPATNWFRAWKIAIGGVREGDVKRISRAHVHPGEKKDRRRESSIIPAGSYRARNNGPREHDGNHFPESINNYDRSDIYGNAVSDGDTRRSLFR